jgi:hypothetical protein
MSRIPGRNRELCMKLMEEARTRLIK